MTFGFSCLLLRNIKKNPDALPKIHDFFKNQNMMRLDTNSIALIYSVFRENVQSVRY